MALSERHANSDPARRPSGNISGPRNTITKYCQPLPVQVLVENGVLWEIGTSVDICEDSPLIEGQDWLYMALQGGVTNTVHPVYWVGR